MRPLFMFVSTVLFVIGFSTHAKQIQPYDTQQPNEFYFTSDVYYVDENATNALIEVGFVPGNRSFSGSVDYKTSDGTAISGCDYGGVTNTLFFSGPAPTKTFSIPIYLDSVYEGDETIQLSLSNSTALITRASAVLIIRNKTAAPKLQFGVTNGLANLSWPTNYSNFSLEHASSLAATNWISGPVATLSGGYYHASAVGSSNVFFRLRLNDTP